MEASGQHEGVATLLLGEKIGTHKLGCWVTPRARPGDLDREKYKFFCRDLNSGPSYL
jgi:hypothetical protein